MLNSKSLYFISSGFRPLPFDADAEHYGCQVPTHPLTGAVEPDNWWAEQVLSASCIVLVCCTALQWFRAKYEAEVFRDLVIANNSFNSSTFFNAVLKRIEKSKL